jgi:hypothetical protein
MAAKIRLSPRLLSDVFWDAVLAADEERGVEKSRLIARLNGLEALRAQAEYDTGSTALPAAWCLYSLARYFQPRRIVEVGTFIGKSAVAMASGLDDQDAPGEVFTCDASNAMPIPWDGRTQLRQFPKTTSTDMLKSIEGACDFVFLDGRLQPDDLALLDGLVTPETIFALDDFEGFEKGVANLAALSRLQKLQSHFLIYPPSKAWLAARGFTSYSLIAVLLPVSTFEFHRQG